MPVRMAKVQNTDNVAVNNDVTEEEALGERGEKLHCNSVDFLLNFSINLKRILENKMYLMCTDTSR
jgi:hypothetical protein